MLKREKNFDEQEFEMLFGDTFFKALFKMVKAGKAAISNCHTGGPNIRRSVGRVGRGYHPTRSSQVNRFNVIQQQSGRGGFQIDQPPTADDSKFTNHQPRKIQ